MERSDQRSQGSGPLIALLVTVAAGLASVPLRPAPAVAAGVVGTGTAESCTESALDVALAGGGLVTFDCGPGQAIIEISTKTIASDTAIDGGGDIILGLTPRIPYPTEAEMYQQVVMGFTDDVVRNVRAAIKRPHACKCLIAS